MDGTKIQTRRIGVATLKVGHTYGARCRRYDKTAAHITILRTFQQRLGDITLEDVKAEGFNTLEEFKETWTKINGAWNPDQIVTAYEFRLCSKTGNPNDSKINVLFKQN